jgi:hypothetical protein
VIAAAQLDTGALHSSQSSWSWSRRAAPQGPYGRLQSTRLSTRAWYGVLRQAPPRVRRMLSEHHHEDNREQGDAGGNRKSPVEWPMSFTCHSNPEKPSYACQTTTRHV